MFEIQLFLWTDCDFYTFKTAQTVDVLKIIVSMMHLDKDVDDSASMQWNKIIDSSLLKLLVDFLASTGQ